MRVSGSLSREISVDRISSVDRDVLLNAVYQAS